MRVAILSDIHANLQAFEEVLLDIKMVGVDSTVCLGDIIGYGPDPNEVVNMVRSLPIPCVMGNHELALARSDFLRWFNSTARKSILISERLITPENRDWLSRLDTTLIFEGALFVHGCPPDSITEYLFEWSDEGLVPIFDQMAQDICFVGHTHTLEAVSFKNGLVEHHILQQGTFCISKDAKFIINVGSVGQPRDGDYHAKYVIWDTLDNSIETRFVSYNIAKTAAKIIRLGFPRINATRLGNNNSSEHGHERISIS